VLVLWDTENVAEFRRHDRGRGVAGIW